MQVGYRNGGGTDVPKPEPTYRNRNVSSGSEYADRPAVQRQAKNGAGDYLNYESEDAMAARTSRAYKLQLSDEGLGHFIDCHCRLARLAGDLIPYGVTLYAAMTVFAALNSSEQIAELEAPLSSRLAGRSVHFVGFSPDLRALIVHISDSISASGEVARNPLVSRLYVAGLAAFASAEDDELRHAYGKAREVLAARASHRCRVPSL